MKRDVPIVLDGGSTVSCTVPPLPEDVLRAKRQMSAIAYLYAIRRPQSREVKIGVAVGILKRLAALQTAHSVPLDLCLAVPSLRAVEREIHLRFADARLMGEWFRETPEVRNWLDEASAAIPASPDAFTRPDGDSGCWMPAPGAGLLQLCKMRPTYRFALHGRWHACCPIHIASAKRQCAECGEPEPIPL